MANNASGSQKNDEGYAHRVVVPVSNPRTAPQLIRFAASLAHPKKGKVRALYIRLPEARYEDAAEPLEQICQTARAQHMPVELLAISANSVPRGVLDATREFNADLLVLGFQASRDGTFIIGEVTESVARVVPIDLIVYRHVQDAKVERILVPVTDIEGTENALMHASHVAQARDVPLYAMYIETNSPTPFWRTDAPPAMWQQISLMEMAIYDKPYRDTVQQKIIKSTDIVGGVVSEAGLNDLVMMSVQRSDSTLNKWLFGPTAQKMLRLAPGSVALVRRHDDEDDTLFQQIQRYLQRWTPTLTLNERDAVINEAGDLVRTNTNYIVMIILSGILASIGLLQSSAAVVIGAMLVAPLMSPLMGFGVGLAIGELTIMRRSSITVAYGVALVLFVSTLVGVLSAFPLPTQEMLARGEPTFLDMVVALASGVAGAFALARKDIPAALAGTAIAAALVPPICTTGLALGMGNIDLMIGAGTLSLVNIVSISIASSGTFAIMGVQGQGEVPLQRRLLVSIMLLLVIGIPLTFLLYSATQRSQIEYQAEQVLEKRFRSSEVTTVEIRENDLFVTMRSPREISIPEMVAAEEEIEDRLERDVSLHLIVLPIIQAEND